MGLKKLRKAKGITASQFGERSWSILRESIRRWDKDLDEVRFKHVVKIAEVLEVEVNGFFVDLYPISFSGRVIVIYEHLSRVFREF